MDILYLITDNYDLSNKIGDYIRIQRKYKENFLKCMDDIHNIKFNMIYLKHLKNTLSMNLLLLYNKEKYNSICKNITDFTYDNQLITFNYYNKYNSLNKGRLNSIRNTDKILHKHYKSNNALPLLYIKLQRDLNRNRKYNREHNNLTATMYNRLNASKSFKYYIQS